jgi:hypothetical protein
MLEFEVCIGDFSQTLELYILGVLCPKLTELRANTCWLCRKDINEAKHEALTPVNPSRASIPTNTR